MTVKLLPRVRRSKHEARQDLGRARAAGDQASMIDTDARFWHPWLRINSVLRMMLHTHWSAEAWAQVRVEFRRALALRSEIRRAGWFITEYLGRGDLDGGGEGDRVWMTFSCGAALVRIVAFG